MRSSGLAPATISSRAPMEWGILRVAQPGNLLSPPAVGSTPKATSLVRRSSYLCHRRLHKTRHCPPCSTGTTRLRRDVMRCSMRSESLSLTQDSILPSRPTQHDLCPGSCSSECHLEGHLEDYLLARVDDQSRWRCYTLSALTADTRRVASGGQWCRKNEAHQLPGTQTHIESGSLTSHSPAIRRQFPAPRFSSTVPRIHGCAGTDRFRGSRPHIQRGKRGALFRPQRDSPSHSRLSSRLAIDA